MADDFLRPPPARLHPRLDGLDRHQHAGRARAASRRLRGVRAHRPAPRRRPVRADRALAPALRRDARRRRGQRARPRVKAAGIATEVLAGAQALEELAAHPDVDQVMAAIVGAAGLPACLAAARAGKRLLLANKEALVVGGQLFVDAVREGGGTLIPIDSEHSAIFQCLPIRSGGVERHGRPHRPHRLGRPVSHARSGHAGDVTPDQACAHPNWVMGRKISVDSATMMNKALEVIEARWLFDLPPERIKVVIHPQSIIHSMVVARDGAVLAQLGTPDMKGPISVGLSWPSRMTSGCDRSTSRRWPRSRSRRPTPCAFPACTCRGPRCAPRRAPPPCSTPPTRSPSRPSSMGRLRFDGIHRVNAQALERVLPSASDATLRRGAARARRARA
jgi:1-deoxy-D-xylulose-5-phosphate reductoisomerase